MFFHERVYLANVIIFIVWEKPLRKLNRLIVSNYNERGHPQRDVLFQLATLGRLRLSVFLDGEFASVVAALGAYMVIHHPLFRICNPKQRVS